MTCAHCKHLQSTSYEHTCDGVKHYAYCALTRCRNSLWDTCKNFEKETQNDTART